MPMTTQNAIDGFIEQSIQPYSRAIANRRTIKIPAMALDSLPLGRRACLRRFG